MGYGVDDEADGVFGSCGAVEGAEPARPLGGLICGRGICDVGVHSLGHLRRVFWAWQVFFIVGVKELVDVVDVLHAMCEAASDAQASFSTLRVFFMKCHAEARW